MPNIHTSQPPTELLRARLSILFENINSLYKNKTAIVEEDLVSSYHGAMNMFLKSLDGSITGTVSAIMKGSPADPFHYNIFTNAISSDLSAIYSETGILDRIVTGSFNSIIAEKEQVLQISRRVSDKLGTYLLYADPSLGAGYFFGDSFNSPENIETESTLLDTDECFLGQNEGVVLLPLDGKAERPKIKSYVINKPSNGTPGNNYEIGVVGHSAIESISDDEPNTWYEYERVTAYESNTPLILDLTIALSEISIINHIHINPINFGTPAPINILKLETSKDGLEYISIKDEVPIKDFVSEDEDNTFELSPATAKFAGQGFYSFLPRKTQFVHIVFQQSTPYAINTNNGTRVRYAIGIRDINILSRKFKSEGSIISRPFNVNGEARKIALFASENPSETSALADITHAISENDGAVWRKIQPQHRSGFEIPEVIDYNTIVDSAISTDLPVESLRHKIYMKRDAKAFEGNVTLKEEKVTQIDIVNIPIGGDFSMTTTQKPIADMVRIILPFYGSFSCPTARHGSSIQGNSTPMDLDMLEFNVDLPANTADGSTDVLKFDLPFAGFENLPEHIRVFYNSSQIEYCAKDAEALGLVSGIDSYTSYPEVNADSKIYFLGKGGRQLQFGYIDDTDTRRGFLPISGSKIQVCFDGDSPRLELTDRGYVLLLSANSDGFKENVSLISMNHLSLDESTDHIVELPAGRDKTSVVQPLKKYRKQTKFLRVGTKKVIPSSSIDEFEKEMDIGEQSIAIETEEGMLPPVFIPDIGSWTIIEYDLTGEIITSGNMIFTTKREFIDGRQELLDFDDVNKIWVENDNTYSFDPYTGNVYTGSLPLSDRKTMFKCKIVTATEVPEANWEYYRHSITNKINTQKIILDPKYVVTHTKIRTISDYRDGLGISSIAPMKTIQLLGVQENGHDWFKQKLVKGTVKINSSVFLTGSKPTEVPFVDGESELYNLVQIQDELISLTYTSSNIYTYQLGQINADQILSGSPGFAGIRSKTNPNPPANYFETYVNGTPTQHGEWTYDTSGLIKVYLASTTDLTALHAVSYRYKAIDVGMDISGLYSIDYTTGTIHFAEPTVNDGKIQFEVSTYSAFYNIAEVIPDGDIKKIDEEGRKITLSTSFGMRFLKMSTALKARPAFAKIAYEYYKQSTESLKDLELYFSPICKDIAIKAITSSTLEEL